MITLIVEPAPSQAAEAILAPQLAAATGLLAEAAESSTEEKIRAAGVVGVVAPDAWLILSDRDFVFKIWQNAAGSEVRAGAELALAADTPTGCTECTVFIQNGIHDANTRDIDNEIRDATAARLAREAKQQAASVIGIVATPEMLILTDKDFIYLIWERATTPKIKAAALVAFDASADQQKEFIANGIREAYAQDQRDKIAADAQATEAEKIRLAARDAKKRVCALLEVAATEQILSISDNRFLQLIAAESPTTSQVHSAAQSALQSADPAVWQSFIETGIYDAHWWDVEIERMNQETANRELVKKIMDDAGETMMRPRLVSAAATVLGSSGDQIEAFLRTGQYQFLTQSLRATTVRSSAWYASSLSDGSLTAAPQSPMNSAAWKIHDGLAGTKCVSLESVIRSGYYLRRVGQRAVLAASDGTAAFKQDSTWCARVGATGSNVSIESFSMRGKYLRNLDQSLFVANASGATAADRVCGYNNDLTWSIENPNPADTLTPDDQLSRFCGDVQFASGQPNGQVALGFTNTAAERPHGGTTGVDQPKLQLSASSTNGPKHIHYAGVDNSATTSYAYMKAYAPPNVRVTSTTRLEYSIYPERTITAGGAPGSHSTCVSVDLLFSNGSVLRNLGAMDGRGFRAHPASQCASLSLNVWNRVVVPLGVVASGLTITQVMVAYDQPVKTGNYSGYVDDIVITR